MDERNGAKKLYMLRGSLAAKITAGVLLVVICAVALASLFGVAVLVDDGAYNGYPSKSFYDSELCRMVTNYHFNRLSNLFYNDRDYLLSYFEDSRNEYYGDNTNVLFTAGFYRDMEEYEKGDDPYDTLQNCNGEGVSGHYVFYTSAAPSNDASVYAGVASSGDTYSYYAMDFVKVDIYVRSPLLDNGEGYTAARYLYDFLHRHTIDLILWLAASVIIAIALFIFLLCSAGHRRDSDVIHLNWFDKIPLDLLAAVFGIGIFFFLYFVIDISYFNYLVPTIVLGVLSLFAAGSLALAFSMTFAGRIKFGKWWKNTLIYRWLWRGLRRLFRFAKEKLLLLFRMLPLAWRSALVFCAAALVNIILAYQAFWHGSGGFVILLLVFDFILFLSVIWASYQMRILKKGGEELASGRLDYKIDTGKMLFEFKKHGENLNSISEGMSRAVDERMKSEHFKTELITNVSHDIKTPLTSIINYVDLLKKEESGDEKASEYIEVLERQSARLKKLTEDLVEASKASSGVLKVEKSKSDARELLCQALGEYESRLEAAKVEVIVREPSESVDIMCDGRLMWRVFDNLLGNICKYAQPGTRAFIDIDKDDGRVWMIFKNTSREVLNISSDELMERFVRGDRARNTEGSGLGLSIAQSLMELQGGTFSLYLDGDLFKVIMTLPNSFQ